MNLNRKAHGARTSVISSQAIDNSTRARTLLNPTYWLSAIGRREREKELGARIWDLGDRTMNANRRRLIFNPHIKKLVWPRCRVQWLRRDPLAPRF
jgi:hypothetical protein